MLFHIRAAINSSLPPWRSVFVLDPIWID